MKSQVKKSFTQVIVNKGTTLSFGKHRGKTVREVLRDEPSYIIWATDEGVIDCPDNIYDEAQDKMYEREIDNWRDNYYPLNDDAPY